MEKYEYKIGNITLTKLNYTDFVIEKKTNRTHYKIKFTPSVNYFGFFDIKNEGYIDLKGKCVETLQNYFKKIIGTNSLPIILFNAEFDIKATKESLNFLHALINKNWEKNSNLYAYSQANLLFGTRRLYTFDTFYCSAANTIDLLYSIPTQYDFDIYKDPDCVEFAKAYRKFIDAIPEKIENKYGYTIADKSQKISNAIYWGSILTESNFNEVAETYLDEGYAIDELPYCNISYRFESNKGKELMKIIADEIKIIEREHLTNYLRKDVLYVDNEDRENHLKCWITELLMKNKLPENFHFFKKYVENKVHINMIKMGIIYAIITHKKDLMASERLRYNNQTNNFKKILNMSDEKKKEVLKKIDNIFNSTYSNGFYGLQKAINDLIA